MTTVAVAGDRFEVIDSSPTAITEFMINVSWNTYRDRVIDDAPILGGGPNNQLGFTLALQP